MSEHETIYGYRATVARLAILGVSCILGTLPAHATCTGSALAWSCSAGSTTSDVQSAINSASDGATITFGNGAYTWSSWVQFSMSKAVTLICATGATCTVNSSGNILGINGFSGTSNKLYRVSGFTFTTSNSPTGIIWFDACNPGCRGTLSQIRLDHNTINLTGAGNHVFWFGDTASAGYYYGVIDHNAVTTNAGGALVFMLGKQDASPPSAPAGTANNMFVEDNTFNSTVLDSSTTSVPCFSDAWGAGSQLVFRFNTIYNCLVPVHGIDHAGGPLNFEVYNNKFIFNSGTQNSAGVNDGYRMVHHQGSGIELFFNNRFTPKTEPHSGEMISITGGYEGSAGCSTYPCSHQAGRDFQGNLFPIYGWNNMDTVNGSIINLDSNSSTTYLALNRDFYNAVSASANSSATSPFNGTTGMGFGTLANRPTTCTHSNATFPTRSPQDDGHGGVGYAVETITGTIGASSGAGQMTDVMLYTCTATNTWTQVYVPYVYPHPLVTGGGGGGGADVTLAAPTGLPVTVQ